MIEPETLLAPVSADAPCGIDLRNPTRRPELYDMLGVLRGLRQMEDPCSDPAMLQWRGLDERCRAILLRHSKDLEVAANLAEAAVYTDGFAGLAAAGETIAGLIERYWDGLFPAPYPDEKDVTPATARLAPLLNLVTNDSRLQAAIRRLVLFTLDDGTAFTCRDCQSSRSLRPEARTAALNAMKPEDQASYQASPSGRLWSDVCQALRADPSGAIAATRDSVSAALRAWQQVAAAARAAQDGGALAWQVVIDLLRDIERMLQDVAPGEPGAVVAELPSDVAAAAPAFGAAPPAVASREHALQRLEEIAAFFQRTEPHSPMAYMLEEAVRRARLPWPDWLVEAVPDQQQRQMIRSRLGLRPEGN